MSTSAIMAAIAAKDPEDLRAAIVGELCVVIPSNVDPQTWDERELGASGGNIWQAVIWQERLWFLDPDDASTDHDGLTCIVTLGGSRYKTNDVRFPDYVLSREIATPPDGNSPAPDYGDTYLVPDGATDDWATKEGQRAMWSARGWQYKPKKIGELVYVADPLDLGFIHVNDQDEWEDGVGPRNLIDGSVLPRHLLIRSWEFINDTTTAPPASGPAGEQYIIGAAATGAWAGHDKKIAWRPADDAAFVIVAPFIGETGWNQALGREVRWNGTTWQSSVGAVVGFKTTGFQAGGAAVNSGSAGYTYSPTAAPTTSARRSLIASLAYARTVPNSKLRIRARSYADQTTNGWVGLWIDAATSAAQHTVGLGIVAGQISEEFIITPSDNASHTYAVHFGRASGENPNNYNYELTIEEMIETA
jgi:hypothetical protein